MRTKVEIKRDIYCPVDLFKWYVVVRDQYLHADGTIHTEVHNRKTNKWAGRFRTYREARAAIRVYRSLKRS
jgi:hypothetical protein